MDGTSQRKCFPTTFRLLTVISINNGKGLEVAALCKSCRGCTGMKKIAFSYSACHETWKLSHNFNLSYTGSPPGMEIAGATKIFSSSKEKHRLY